MEKMPNLHAHRAENPERAAQNCLCDRAVPVRFRISGLFPEDNVCFAGSRLFLCAY